MNDTITATLTDADIAAVTFFKAGYAWAETLAPGDTFRGSYGEAVWRGLSDWDAKFFSAGGQAGLAGKSVTLVSDRDNIIHTIA